MMNSVDDLVNFFFIHLIHSWSKCVSAKSSWCCMLMNCDCHWPVDGCIKYEEYNEVDQLTSDVSLPLPVDVVYLSTVTTVIDLQRGALNT